jgi:hypothetical protein
VYSAVNGDATDNDADNAYIHYSCLKHWIYVVKPTLDGCRDDDWTIEEVGRQLVE